MSDTKQVVQDEVADIKQRREEKFRSAKLDKEKLKVESNLVGLALSGGGIRSAAFSIGVVQALQEKKVFPFVDYLSTVSGGGYAGAFVSSNAIAQNDDRKRQAGADGDGKGAILPKENGRQPKKILEFTYGGDYIRRTWSFLNRHVIGLFLILVVAATGIVAATSIVAYQFRKLDGLNSRFWLDGLGFSNDLMLAFFPAFVLFICWILAWAVSYIVNRQSAKGQLARVLFVLFAFSSMLAVAALMGTGDISIASFQSWLGLDHSSLMFGGISHIIWASIIGTVAAGLLPYLRPSLLLKSGTRPKNVLEKVTFWFAARALLFGVPFVLIAIFAREDISRSNERRRGDLQVPAEIKNWTRFNVTSPFWREILAGDDELSKDIKQLTGLILAANDHHAGDRLNQTIRDIVKETRKELDADGTREKGPFTELAAERLRIPNLDLSPLAKMTDTKFRDLANACAEAEQRENEVKHMGGWISLVMLPFDALQTKFEIWRMDEDGKEFEAEMEKENDLWAHQAQRHRVFDIKVELTNALSIATVGDPAFHKRVDILIPQNSGRRTKELRKLLNQANRLENEVAAAKQTRNGSADPASDAGGNSREEQAMKQLVPVNRQLLGALYPEMVQPKETVFSLIVCPADQDFRFNVFLLVGIVFLVGASIVDLNASSCHGFYADLLSEVWIERPPGMKRRIPLAQLNTTAAGYPYHLLSASWCLLGRIKRKEGFIRHEHFLFSKHYCGSDRTRYEATKDFLPEDYSLEDAIAISGAAVSAPHMRNPLVIALLLLGNFRLGQWVSNPSRKPLLPWNLSELFARYWPVTPLRFALSLVQPAEEQQFCFVADGGYFDNLGLEPLLQRKCKFIVAVDAGEDGKGEFQDLMKIVRWARMKHGIAIEPIGATDARLPLNELTSRLVKDRSSVSADGQSAIKKEHANRHFFLARIRYPREVGYSGYLLYLKPSVTGDEPEDLMKHWETNEQFPHDATTDQFFSSSQFESYRSLGYHIASDSLSKLPLKRLVAALKKGDVEEFTNLWPYFLEECECRRHVRRFLQQLSGTEVEQESARDELDLAQGLLNDDEQREYISYFIEQLTKSNKAKQPARAKLKQLSDKMATAQKCIYAEHLLGELFGKEPQQTAAESELSQLENSMSDEEIPQYVRHLLEILPEAENEAARGIERLKERVGFALVDLLEYLSKHRSESDAGHGVIREALIHLDGIGVRLADVLEPDHEHSEVAIDLLESSLSVGMTLPKRCVQRLVEVLLSRQFSEIMRTRVVRVLNQFAETGPEALDILADIQKKTPSDDLTEILGHS